MLKPRIHFGVVATFLISGAIPLAGSILVQLYFPDWHWTHEPFHSVVEAAGAFIALTVAVLLLQMRGRQDAVHFTWIASALIGMGLLDGFHSALRVGGGFVRTHSMAVLLGGLLFSLIWLPDHLARTRLAKALPGLTAVIATVVGLLIAAFPDKLPAMLNHDGFTPVAKAVNFSGGMFFIAAGIRFLLRYQARSRKDDLLFANQCLLFGGAGVLFANSTLWDAAWWYWHLLRLVAYLVVFGYAFSIYHYLRDELHGSEARSRALLHAIPDLIIRFDLDGTLLDFQAHEDSPDLKPPPPVIVGANIYESPMRREVVDQIMCASRRAVETGDTQTVEFSYSKETEPRHYEARIVASGADELVATVRNITERKRAEETIRESEERVRLLLNSTAEGIFGADTNGKCTFANPAALRLLGFDEPSQVLGQNIHLLSHHTRADGTQYPVEECRGIRAVRRGESIHVDDEVFWRADGTAFPVEYWSYPVRHGEEVVGGVVTFVDITERKRMKDAIQDEKRFVSTILETVGALIVVLDTEGRIVRFNQACEQITGYSFAEARDRHVWEFLLVPDEIEQVIAIFDNLRLTRFPNRHENYWVTKSGERRLIAWSNTVLQDSEGAVTHVVGTGIDITERKQVEEALRLSQDELRALAGRLISAKEEEARRIARELHDEFGQRLAVLNLTAAELAGLLSSQPELAAEKLQVMSREIGSVAKALHDLSRHLHPSVLSQLGLEMALESDCASFSKQHGIAVSFSAESVPELMPAAMALCLYRIAQESLLNISKHAQARTASVALRGSDREIIMVIRDSGRGFDLDAVRGKGGLGLVSMEERVRLVNGSLSVYSKPGEGTQVEVRIPIGGS